MLIQACIFFLLLVFTNFHGTLLEKWYACVEFLPSPTQSGSDCTSQEPSGVNPFTPTYLYTLKGDYFFLLRFLLNNIIFSGLKWRA